MTDRGEEASGECQREHVDDGDWLKGPPPGWLVAFYEEGSAFVTLPVATQAIILWPGDRLQPVILTDNDDPNDLPPPLFAGVRGRVLATRLRYWAEAIEDATPHLRPAVP